MKISFKSALLHGLFLPLSGLIAVAILFLCGCAKEEPVDPFDFNLEFAAHYLEGECISEVRVDPATGFAWAGRGRKNIESGNVSIVDPADGTVVPYTASEGLLGSSMMWDFEFDGGGRAWLAGWGHGVTIVDCAGTPGAGDDLVWTLRSGDTTGCLAGSKVRGLMNDGSAVWIVSTGYEGIDFIGGTGAASESEETVPWSGPCVHYDLVDDTPIAGGRFLVAVCGGGGGNGGGDDGGDGVEWIAEREFGLHRWDDAGTPEDSGDDAWEAVDESVLAGISPVEELAVSADGSVWASCPGSGLVAGPDPWRMIGWDDGLPDPDNGVNCAVPDARGRIWVFTDRGIAVLDGDGVVRRTMTLADDLPFDTFYSGDYDNERGEVWVGGEDGLVRIRVTGQ